MCHRLGCAYCFPKKRTRTHASPVVAGPLDTQVGGDHYKKLAIQPIEYAMKNKLDPCQANVVKYVTRFRDKNGLIDLEKAEHYIQMLKEEYKK